MDLSFFQTQKIIDDEFPFDSHHYYKSRLVLSSKWHYTERWFLKFKSIWCSGRYSIYCRPHINIFCQIVRGSLNIIYDAFSTCSMWHVLQRHDCNKDLFSPRKCYSKTNTWGYYHGAIVVKIWLLQSISCDSSILQLGLTRQAPSIHTHMIEGLQLNKFHRCVIDKKSL